MSNDQISDRPDDNNFQHVKTWVFDLDNTLYPAENNLFSQVDINITNYVSKLLDLPFDDARKIQKKYLLEHGTTLNGLIHNHSVNAAHYLDSVHDIDFAPIARDLILDQALQNLEGRKVIFTNADTPYAEKVLERIGIAHHFDGIFDIIAADLAPKPEVSTYDRFFDVFAIDPKQSVMFEDMVRNLIPAKQAGMGTVWVNTGSPWGEADYDASVINVETKQLTPWLDEFVNQTANR
ncbi:pyrimidine 5'-nucleotidase [Kordiimonas sp. SCSIO 12610]|uniref:pyrimidine 5'-nucleotidase n=1 Tax=Kordiimonas sp. SCSIO 12610 TaxID=2829597 RepID=UPI00210C3F47|nr:pyrimidine 5'-nucleotidase [Kordiimonas sp. SCSIO 12610]UTW55178.1 pyrimidine 5'-nucleotidase [Kordiimonas sp. SCSIO 12610]